MVNLLYIDCFSGISGDMMVGALLNLGKPEFTISVIEDGLRKLNIGGYQLKSVKTETGSLHPTEFDVFVENDQPFRNFKDIRRLINESGLDDRTKKISIDIFSEIANAESKVHNKTVDEVHFHEVGAVDSIVDIVSVAIAVVSLKLSKIYCSKVPVGRGSVKTMHGILPVPAPATVEILKGLPVYGGDFNFEVTTPTGAAIVKTLVSKFNALPDMQIDSIGYGAGKGYGSGKTAFSENKNFIPDILRVFLGKETRDLRSRENIFKETCFGNLLQINTADDSKVSGTDQIPGLCSGINGLEKLIILSSNMDDLSPEITGYVFDRIFAMKALDVWLEPILMKKNRQAFKLCVLCRHEDLRKISETIFKETNTLGIRVEEVARSALKREERIIKLPYGKAKVKLGFLDKEVITISPEFESCKMLAKKTKKPLKVIYNDLIFFFSKK